MKLVPTWGGSQSDRRCMWVLNIPRQAILMNHPESAFGVCLATIIRSREAVKTNVADL